MLVLPLPSNHPKSPRPKPATHRALLARLPLSVKSKQNLEQRGLSPEAIARSSYGYLPVQGRAKQATAPHDEFGDQLLGVPGFGFKEGDNGPYLTISGAAGILIPVRDPAGQIAALKVRRDDAGAGLNGWASFDLNLRYLYVSSASHGGPGPGSPAHVPLGVTVPCDLVGLTEGELKADVAFALGDIPIISAPGAANLAALPGSASYVGCQDSSPPVRRRRGAEARSGLCSDGCAGLFCKGQAASPVAGQRGPSESGGSPGSGSMPADRSSPALEPAAAFALPGAA